MIEYDVFPEGKRCAVTFSFDDGEYDEQVIEILDKYNLKATFFLNSHVMMERGLSQAKNNESLPAKDVISDIKKDIRERTR